AVLLVAVGWLAWTHGRATAPMGNGAGHEREKAGVTRATCQDGPGPSPTRHPDRAPPALGTRPTVSARPPAMSSRRRPPLAPRGRPVRPRRQREVRPCTASKRLSHAR